MPTPLKTRVLLADDHAIVRSGLRAVLDGEPDIEVVAEAQDGVEAVDKTLAGDVDLAILDVSMPRLTGLQATAELRRRRRDMLGLERIHRPRHARLDVAEGAGPRAGVAEDHHRRVLLGPALADVRAGRFLANSSETEVAHQPARRVIAFADWRLDADPVGLALLGWN